MFFHTFNFANVQVCKFAELQHCEHTTGNNFVCLYNSVSHVCTLADLHNCTDAILQVCIFTGLFFYHCICNFGKQVSHLHFCISDTQACMFCTLASSYICTFTAEQLEHDGRHVTCAPRINKLLSVLLWLALTLFPSVSSLPRCLAAWSPRCLAASFQVIQDDQAVPLTANAVICPFRSATAQC